MRQKYSVICLLLCKRTVTESFSLYGKSLKTQINWKQ